MSNIKAIIFDFDGVFVDSLSCIHQAYNYLFDKTRRPRIESLEEFKEFMTIDFDETYRKLGIITEEEKTEAKRYVQEYLDKNYLETPVFQEMVDFTKTLPHKMGIASSGKEYLIEIKLRRMDLLYKMFSIIGSTKVSKLKPHPESIIKCSKNLGVSLDNILFVGDTYVDMRAGKAANIAMTIGVDWGFEPAEKLWSENPDGVISKPIELLNYL
ncbi:MAG: HAD family hydrolase [Nanoarchaeota archaeon]|nr:HAD family hydrolase [Nanoarchaeota archaeon]